MGIWGARVLVLGDDDRAVEAVGHELRARGADVIPVASVGAALSALIGVAPDVLVVDVSIPGADGLGFVRTVRSFCPEKGGQVPAISLSAGPLRGARLQEWRAGLFQAHFPKPVRRGELAAAVARLAGGAAERRRRDLHPRYWPCGVSRDRRAEVRTGPPLPSLTVDLLLRTARA